MTQGVRQSILALADLLEAVVNLGTLALEAELAEPNGPVDEDTARLLGEVLGRTGDLVNAVRSAAVPARVTT